MKPNKNLWAVLAIGLIVAAFTVGAASSDRPTFEYQVLSNGAARSRLYAVGKDGWELVAVYVNPVTGEESFYVKRQIR
ncbi:MAG: hypothetical protein HYV96_19770 [Opitutae bacterium]|nr:hypothetical protein [Opitutae bacterium]